MENGRGYTCSVAALESQSLYVVFFSSSLTFFYSVLLVFFAGDECFKIIFWLDGGT